MSKTDKLLYGSDDEIWVWYTGVEDALQSPEGEEVELTMDAPELAYWVRENAHRLDEAMNEQGWMSEPSVRYQLFHLCGAVEGLYPEWIEDAYKSKEPLA